MTSQRGWPLNPYEASVLAIFTFQSKQHALFAAGASRPAPGVTLLTSGLRHLFGALQKIDPGGHGCNGEVVEARAAEGPPL